MLYGKCEICNRNAFFVGKREITLPIGGKATSKKQMCGKCHQNIKKAIGTK